MFSILGDSWGKGELPLYFPFGYWACHRARGARDHKGVQEPTTLRRLKRGNDFVSHWCCCPEEQYKAAIAQARIWTIFEIGKGLLAQGKEIRNSQPSLPAQHFLQEQEMLL